MSPRIRAVSFTLFADRVIDATIHPAILQSLAIIPPEWELLTEPIFRDSQVQLVFTNQISLTINSECIVFSEIITQQQLPNLTIPSIIAAYLQFFYHIGYRSLFITSRSEISFDLTTEIDEYIRQRLLLSNFWQSFSNQSKNDLNIKIAYPYKAGNFFLEISYNNPEFLLSNNHTIYFTGSFFYSLSGNNEPEKLEHLQTLISQWQIDVNNFSNFIEQHF